MRILMKDHATNQAANQVESIEADAQAFRDAFERTRREIAKVVVGHKETVEGVLVCLFAGGHCLLEGVPGLGKTLLIRSLSQALALGAKVKALLGGRTAVSFDDIKSVALPALRHRILMNFEAEAEGRTSDEVVQHIIDTLVLDAR